MKRIPELDGVRGIAISMVVIGHYFVGTISTQPGTVLSYVTKLLSTVSVSGVDLFFVLSGFLIGGILLDNRDASNFFTSFYIRRTCRIFPIYYLWLAAFLVLIAIPLPNTFLVGHDLSLWGYFFYLQNLVMIIAPNNGLGSIWLGITWSLAIEEQFYLTAPLLIHKLSRRILANVLFLFLVLGLIFRFILLQYPQGDFYSYVFTFTRLDGLILGVLSALLFRSSFKLRLIDLNEKALALLIFMIPLGIAVDVFRVFRPIKCLSYLFLSIGYTAFLLIAITHSSNIFSRITQSRLLQHIGLLAYGLYIYHSGINGLMHLAILGHDPALHSWKDIVVTILSLVIVYGIARVSWMFIESPMIQLGHRTEYQLKVRRELSLT